MSCAYTPGLWYGERVLYPVAPEKLKSFIKILHEESDLARIPRPEITSPEDREGLVEELDKHLDKYTLSKERIDGHHAVVFRGRTFLIVDVSWPSPLRTLDNNESFLRSDSPVGPNRLGMWAVLQYLRDPDSGF